MPQRQTVDFGPLRLWFIQIHPISLEFPSGPALELRFTFAFALRGGGLRGIVGVGRHFRQSSSKRPTVACEGLETRLLFTVRYVDINKNASSNPGVWATATTSLTGAISSSVAGDEIRVADGTYFPSSIGDRTVSFTLKSGVQLTGGWAGRSAADPNTRDPALYVTTLSGDVGTRFVSSDNSYRIVTGSFLNISTLLEGFTIRDAVNTNAPNDRGGGLYLNQSSMTIRNCTFTNNVAASGGAIAFDVTSSSYQLTLQQCTFGQNSSTSPGGAVNGGVGSLVATDCLFSNNMASSGGAVEGFARLSITNSTFQANHANVDGGAIRAGFINLTGCVFEGNSSGQSGGAVSADSNSSVLQGCTFTGNSAASWGGGAELHSNYTGNVLQVSNCTFSGNSASTAGGLSTWGGKSVILSSCVFKQNRATESTGGLRSDSSASPNQMTACVFNGNTGPVYAGCSLKNYVVTNTSFVGNVEGVASGWIVGGTNVTLSNSVVAYNASRSVIGGLNATDSYVRNSILWGNTSASSYAPNPVNCDLQSTAYNGPGVIHADPQFVRTPSPGADTVWGTADDDYGDLRLQATSPCIDAGSNAYVPTGVTTDLAGQARFADVPGMHDPGVITDMGAYEAVTTLAVTDRSFLTDATSPTVKFAFNANLATSTLNGGDLQLLNQTTGDLFDTSTLVTTAYDLATFSASWLLPTNLPDGNYHATLQAGSIADAGLNTLTSSDQLDFFIMAGDANRDRKVDTQDFNLLVANFGGSAKVFSQGNFDYDPSGNVDSTDFDILVSQYGKRLAAPSAQVATAPAGSIFAPMPGNREKTDESVLT